ncbi:hypothetical protein EV363DRAFT_1306058 [Boletus edulis]|nr:hypothetical protein EV363DRAFT_1306058 [Boletus edulis]
MATQPKSGDSSRVARAEKMVTTEGETGCRSGTIRRDLGMAQCVEFKEDTMNVHFFCGNVIHKWRDEKHGKRKGFEVLSISITKAVMFPAGAGKSVLAASVIEGLKDTLQDGEVLE